ncbi:MAG: energy transducer TonB [Candidatus Acidiferrales bacterium]
MFYLRALIISVSFLLAGSLDFVQDTNQSTAPQNSTSTPAVNVYPDTADGLRELLQRLVAAIQKDDAQDTSQILQNMVLPDYETWFMQVFGADFGAKIAEHYAESLKSSAPSISSSLRGVVQEGRTNISAKRYAPTDASDQNLFVPALKNAMLLPTTVYEAYAFKELPGTWRFPGFFFYVNGGFRFVSTYALSDVPGVMLSRIRVGSSAQAASITHMVQPVYPTLAKMQHVQGAVMLHAIIGRDGKIVNLEYLGGPPLLKDAAVDAVRQWIYKPTVLQGQAVEVDTTITVVFALGGH